MYPDIGNLRELVLNRQVHTAVVDSGASSSYVQPEQEQNQLSECEQFEIDPKAFTLTNKKSDKTFLYGNGAPAPADDVVNLHLPLKPPATEAHTVPGIKNNLYSLNALVKAGYGAVFAGDLFAVVDADDAERLISRQAIMCGFYVPDKGLWRIPLGDLKGTQRQRYDNGKTAAVKNSPQAILSRRPPPLDPNSLNNVYDLKVQPKIVRYYHAAAGFPTKPTWI